ncbi:carboxylesterase/lipase family protein [Verticiella sediminum]|nr:carboxylesterase family protein [Verticiella sediminum]
MALSTDSEVLTADGRLRGRRAHEVTAFLGIPYAEPPVGEARLRSPRPVRPWAGCRTAERLGPASLQHLAGQHTWLNAALPGTSEDCLYLNVWTAGLTGARPVLVWLHGGQTRHGHGGSPAYEGTALARRGVVVVTVNYRLGALGGLAHPALQDPDSRVCANWGMQDQLLALDWVARNIAAFGGDPARVTLAGQSSGAASAILLAQNGHASGRYAQCIAHSPPLFRPPAYAELDAAAAYAETVAHYVGVGVRELRGVDGAQLQAAERELGARLGVRPQTAPVRDGVFLRRWPHEPRAVVPLPLLIGWTRDEADFWFDLSTQDGTRLSPETYPPADALAARYVGLLAQQGQSVEEGAVRRLLAAHGADRDPSACWRALYTHTLFREPILALLRRQAEHAAPCWGYAFGLALANAGTRAPHGADVPCVFDTWAHPHFADRLHMAPRAVPLAHAMRDAWVRFLTSGDPGWPRFAACSRVIQRIGPDAMDALPWPFEEPGP